MLVGMKRLGEVMYVIVYVIWIKDVGYWRRYKVYLVFG